MQTRQAWPAIAVCVGLTALVWLVFGQTLTFGFINLDDTDYVIKNPHVNGGLTFSGIAWAFTHFRSSNWHPLTWISHMLDCQFYGLQPAGHHFTNVLLHTATSIALFLLLWRMTNHLWRSAAVAAIFAVHPLRAESVAWIAERKDVLSGLFFVLTLAAYLAYTRRGGGTRYLLLVILYAAGLMAKPMLITTPLVLLLLDYWPLKRITPRYAPRTAILEKLPLLLLSLASAGMTLWAQHDSIVSSTSLSLTARTTNAVSSYLIYLRQLFWPADLAAHYPHPTGSIPTLIVAGGVLVLAAVTLLCLKSRRAYLIVGWLWYLFMLLPVIGFVQVGLQSHADRYTYLPQVGVALAVVWLIADLAKRFRIAAGASFVCMIVAAAIAAHSQAAIWHDGERLWRATLARTTTNPRVDFFLGEALFEHGDVQAAIAEYQRAISGAPADPDAHAALGVALMEMSDIQPALGELEKAVTLAPRSADAQYDLANALAASGRDREAASRYRTAISLTPDDYEAMNNAAWLLATTSDASVYNPVEALDLASRANHLTRRTNPRTGATLAACLAANGNFPEAIAVATTALKLAIAQADQATTALLEAHLERYRTQQRATSRDR